ncbi:MAG: hypothetical protein WA192_14280 [Candidatus Acidiferrales bacterium]
MKRRTVVSFAALALAAAALVPGVARAQGSTAGQTSQAGNATAPAATTQSGTAPAAPVTPPAATPAKKVWTNEDMGAVHRESVISTFSGPGGKTGNGKAASTAKGSKDGKAYQARIAQLQAKLPPLDEQIAQLQGALNGDTVNSTRHYSGAKIDDWRDELTRLQKQRDDIAAKISALQDEARRSGVPDNQIP